MDIETEHKSKYLPHSEEELLRCRLPPKKALQNLTLSGDIELTPEYRSSFVTHPIKERTHKITPKEALKVEGIFDVKKDCCEMMAEPKRSAQAAKYDSQKCHLKLEGEMCYAPEYRSQYVQFPIEKSHSIPQLSNIKFEGDFIGMPEYRESFKCYDQYSKSAPIKKADHISFNGKIDVVPEYKEKYKEPEKSAIEKTVSMKTEDHLHPCGDFSKDLPEYYESFKDPQIKKVPERGRCREPYIRLKGKIEFDPEYRSHYLDHPRSRPVCKKAVSTLRISNSTKSPFDSPKRKYKSTSSIKYHHPDEDVPIACRSEYRKARHEYAIKERPPVRKIMEPDGTVRTITKTYNEPGNVEVECKKPSKGRKRFSPHRPKTPPKFKLNDVDECHHGTDFRSAPKYGRRASVARNAHNIREKITVVECNPKYVKGPGINVSPREKKHHCDNSFVVLHEPCKKSGWMKKSWYET